MRFRFDLIVSIVFFRLLLEMKDINFYILLKLESKKDLHCISYPTYQYRIMLPLFVHRHAVRQFVQQNQGLMRRMYGDENYINILRAEFEENDIELKYDEYHHHHFTDDLR